MWVLYACQYSKTGCTCELSEGHLSGRDGVHLDNVVAIQFRVSVALIKQGGTNPVSITFNSFHLPGERGEVETEGVKAEQGKTIQFVFCLGIIFKHFKAPLKQLSLISWKSKRVEASMSLDR